MLSQQHEMLLYSAPLVHGGRLAASSAHEACFVAESPPVEGFSLAVCTVATGHVHCLGVWRNLNA
jgi:hypothetical protein